MENQTAFEAFAAAADIAEIIQPAGLKLPDSVLTIYLSSRQKCASLDEIARSLARPVLYEEWREVTGRLSSEQQELLNNCLQTAAQIEALRAIGSIRAHSPPDLLQRYGQRGITLSHTAILGAFGVRREMVRPLAASTWTPAKETTTIDADSRYL